MRLWECNIAFDVEVIEDAQRLPPPCTHLRLVIPNRILIIMNIYITYGIIFVILLVLELVYFKIADKCNIIDKPNERSSHSTIVLRGGGIIFMLGLWIWAAFTSAGLLNTGLGFSYPWFLAAVTLIAGVSFVVARLSAACGTVCSDGTDVLSVGHAALGDVVGGYYCAHRVWEHRTSSTSWTASMALQADMRSRCCCLCC